MHQPTITLANPRPGDEDALLRRPEATALLAELKNPNREFDAVVIGEPHRAFYGNQYGLTFPLFEHYGVPLWVPEVGGPIDPANKAHDLVMSVFGGMSKSERNRVKIRVRTAMAAQAQVEDRFLGGRPTCSWMWDRCGIAWSRIVGAILANPRYTGRRVWNSPSPKCSATSTTLAGPHHQAVMERRRQVDLVRAARPRAARQRRDIQARPGAPPRERIIRRAVPAAHAETVRPARHRALRYLRPADAGNLEQWPAALLVHVPQPVRRSKQNPTSANRGRLRYVFRLAWGFRGSRAARCRARATCSRNRECRVGRSARR